LLIITIKISNIGERGLVVWENLTHVSDQHTELSSPISYVIGSDHFVTHELKDSAYGLADDGATKVSDMHLFGYVWGGEVDDNLLFLHLGIAKILHKTVDTLLDKGVFNFNL
jgi:hypothetical protein